MNKALVIIPTYDEVENIKTVIDKTLEVKGFDILVVDDSSPDGTADVVLELVKNHTGRLFLEQRAGKEGLGKAYIHGFKWALKKNMTSFLRWMLICLTIPKNCLQCLITSNLALTWSLDHDMSKGLMWSIGL